MSNTQFDTILNNYGAGLSTYDEMWLDADGVQPHWRSYMQAIEQLGLPELERQQQETRRHLRENGVTYNVHGDPENLHRAWALDVVPFIISQQDWRVIETGLKQRAELLNLILTDIYGPQKIIRAGLLPLELIYAHQGFLRQCHEVQLPGSHQLIVYAADLARGPDGRMWVLGDRTQAPSGAGYAVENRTVMARVMGGIFKENKISRLSNYFRELHAALGGLSPRPGQSARVVVLTPGPLNETYFEHAYLAAYLGYSLVQGDDLTVHGGQVSLKSLEGLQPVDVILRRVDDLFCDPLELREDSRLGVAGLLEASRRQNIAIANPLGSSVLENPGLMPFLPGLAHHLLGEELILPAAATWWCGQPKEMEYVLANLPKLMIKQVYRQPNSRTVFGPELSRRALDELRQKIMAQPHLYVGQEQVSFSTTPSFIDGRLEPRHAVMRGFVVAREQGYRVMPGGLTRSAATKGGFIVSNQAGGISKDTWVLAETPQKHTSLWLQAERVERAFKSSYYLPSRAAENLFWVGRYAERAEASARLLRVILNNLNEGDPFGADDEITGEILPFLLRALTHITMTYPGFVDKGSRKRLTAPGAELRAVALSADRPGSLAFNLRSMVQAAYAVRDLWSSDTWRVIDGLEAPLERIPGRGGSVLLQLQPRLNQLISALMAFAGLNTESMTHEAGWLLLDIGRRLERAMLSIALIRATLGPKCPEAAEYLLLDAILRTTENVITYRRRYRSYLQLQTVLDLLLLDATNPRSLTYQLNRLQDHIAQLPRQMRAYRLSHEERLILEATTYLRLADTTTLTKITGKSQVRHELDDFLANLSALLSQLSPVLTQYYFTHVQVPHQLLSSATPPASGLDGETGAEHAA